MDYEIFDDMIGASKKMKAIFAKIKEVAPIDIPVLVRGESGTGKELLASSIHRRSKRTNGPFIPVNTGALNTDLLTTELFGHEKGAFTGAAKQHKGLFEITDSGTIFLDEISTMDMKTQIALLRVLETKKFQRVGSSTFQEVNVRIIAATNENLRRKVREKTFRRDLYHRINVYSILIPPLRKRKKDIIVLTEAFVRKYSKEFDKTTPEVTPAVKKLLSSYAWLGNVRELENTVMQSLISCKSNQIQVEDLPKEIRQGINYKKTFRFPLGKTIKELEKQYIEATLKDFGGNKENTARALGVSRKTLYNKLQKYELT